MPRGVYDRSKVKRAVAINPVKVTLDISAQGLILKLNNGEMKGTFGVSDKGVTFTGPNGKVASRSVPWYMIEPMFKLMGTGEF